MIHSVGCVLAGWEICTDARLSGDTCYCPLPHYGPDWRELEDFHPDLNTVSTLVCSDHSGSLSRTSLMMSPSEQPL